jgi:hypothetical protein
MKVRIYRPSRNAMQSGRGRTQEWVLEYETVSARKPEALMGWSSSQDTLNQVRMQFDTMQEAVAFAEKNGWEYAVSLAHERRVVPRNYVDNFKYVPVSED